MQRNIPPTHPLVVTRVQQLISLQGLEARILYESKQSTYIGVWKDSIRVGTIRVSNHHQIVDENGGVFSKKGGWNLKADVSIIVNMFTKFFNVDYKPMLKFLEEVK